MFWPTNSQIAAAVILIAVGGWAVIEVIRWAFAHLMIAWG